MHPHLSVERMMLLVALSLSLGACGDEEEPEPVRRGASDMKPDLVDVLDLGIGRDMDEPELVVEEEMGEEDCRQGVPDDPDPMARDTNCDGIDGDAMASLFVATYGDDANPGTKILPKKTVQAAIDAAAEQGKAWVLVEIGAYEGPLALKPGVNLVGGYAFGWRRDVRGFTAIRGGNPTVSGQDIDVPTRVMNLELEPSRQIGAGESVFTMVLERSPGLTLERMRLLGGVAGAGAAGEVGAAGGPGNVGKRGGDGKEDGGFGCSTNGRPSGGAGGDAVCGGGAGARGGQPAKDNNTGDAGEAADGGAAGGAGGPASAAGSEGKPGSQGGVGMAGVGATPSGRFEGRVWVGAEGGEGGQGASGNGGGGGGGGGGGASFCDSWGGGGGGGGSGGCGGLGGKGGKGGAASVALLLIESDVVILNSRIVIGAGGQGGAGGDGGQGGQGGDGGAGGNKEDDSGAGGKGGKGGQGGRGGQGGGGQGGPAFGIYTDAALTAAPEQVEYVPGQGGAGGSGAGVDGRGPAGETAEVRVAE